MGRNKKPTAIDLFAGCGGLTVGLKQAGFSVLGAVEIDPLAVETYQSNHPRVKVWASDIRNLSASDLLQELQIQTGELDLLAGCPPCQGFSSIRTLNGSREIEDPRNDLVFDFLRFVEGLRPKAIMMENVPGLAVDTRMDWFWRELKRLGYTGEHRVLDTANYGVPQRRRRMLLLAGKYGKLPFASPSRRRRTVRGAIGRLPQPGLSGDPLHDYPPIKHSERIKSIIRLIERDGGSRTDLPEEFQLPCHRRSDGFKDVYGRMAWCEVAPTITRGCFNPSKGRFLHPEEDRAITLREAALLQSFPCRYFISLRGGRSGAAGLIGNALPPRFIKLHALCVKEYILNKAEDH